VQYLYVTVCPPSTAVPCPFLHCFAPAAGRGPHVRQGHSPHCL
jgi:hypothetical protein